MVQRGNWKIRRTAIEAEQWLLMVNECTRVEICGASVSRACVSSEPFCEHPGHFHDQYQWQRGERPLPCSDRIHQPPCSGLEQCWKLCGSFYGHLDRSERLFRDLHDYAYGGAFISGAKSNDGLECARRIDALGLALPSLAPFDLTEEDVELSAPSVYCMRRARTTRDEHPGKC